MKNITRIITSLLAVLIMMTFCACGGGNGDGESIGKSNKGDKTEVSDSRSLYDYAKALEKAGNSEAAAAVYELIAKGAGAEYIQSAHGIPVVEAADDAEDMTGIFGGRTGGGEK